MSILCQGIFTLELMVAKVECPYSGDQKQSHQCISKQQAG